MLLITIIPGTTEEARQEITCYRNAFSCQTITDSAEAVTLLSPDTDAAPVFMDMEHNTVTDYTTDQNTIIAAVMAA